MLHRNKKEQIADAGRNMDESQKQNKERKKIPDTKEYILHDSTNMKSKNSKTSLHGLWGGREGVLSGKGYTRTIWGDGNVLYLEVAAA